MTCFMVRTVDSDFDALLMGQAALNLGFAVVSVSDAGARSDNPFMPQLGRFHVWMVVSSADQCDAVDKEFQRLKESAAGDTRGSR